MFHSPLIRSLAVAGLAVVLLVPPLLAQQRGGLVTGSFGHHPLELAVAAELSRASVAGGVVDARLTATRPAGAAGPATAVLAFRGKHPSPREVTLDISFPQDGARWRGGAGNLRLELGELHEAAGVLALSGTVTGQVSGGTADETRPVTLSFTARLDPAQ